MTLTKAIEIHTININERNHRMPIDVLSALKLGVEAMKELQVARLMGCALPHTLLPGETKD